MKMEDVEIRKCKYLSISNSTLISPAIKSGSRCDFESSVRENNVVSSKWRVVVLPL